MKYQNTARAAAIASWILCICIASPAHAVFPDKSIAHWDLSVNEESRDPEYLKVHDLMRENKTADALQILENKTKQNSSDSTAHILTGLVLNEMGRHKDALKSLLQGHAIDRQHPALHYGFCQIYRDLGKGRLSERGCEIAVQQHAQSAPAHYEFSLTLAALGKMEEAIDALNTAHELAPKNPRYPLDMGMYYYYLNRIADAEQAFLKTIALDENNLDANYEIAYLYAAQGKAEKAKTHIFRVLETRLETPKVKSANRLLKLVNQNALEKLPLKIEPHEYHLSKSKAYYQSGKYGLSFIEIQTASRIKPDDAHINEIHVGMCSLLLRLDAAEEAVRHFIELAGENKPKKARGYQELGDIRIVQGKLDQAREFYEKAESLGDPGNLAKITLKQFSKDLKPAVLHSPDEIFIEPTRALNRKGEIFAHYKMYDRAIAIYSMVIRMDPDHLDSLLNTATAYYNSGNNGRAISILERALIAHPNHDNILAHRFLLAQAYVKNGNEDESLKNLEKIIQINPSMKSRIESDPVFESLRNSESYKKRMP